MVRSDRGDITHRISGDVPQDIESLVADVETHQTGFFGPESVIWRVNRETVLRLSGVSAILLQLAHPLVAAGVDDHSRFDEAPIGRFRRTFELVHTIRFGSVDTAVAAARTIRAVHAEVRGTIDADAGPFASGEHYAASNPELLLWVHATLIDQSLTAYETYVATLTETEKAEYYRESKIFGQLLGIPAETYPETLADFYDYYDRMLATEITVGRRARELQRTLFDNGPMLRPLYRFLGASTLPDSVRSKFGLPWTARRQRLFDRGATFVRAVLPSLPDRLRYADNYLQARDRLTA